MPPVRRSPARGWPRACLGLACVLAVAAGLAGSPPQRDSEPFARWAAGRAIRLGTGDPGRLAADPRPLKAMIGGARVVALGEPTHGAHESLELRNRLFRFLVEELGFTAIAIESGLPESRRVFDFVNGAPGIAGDVARRNLTWGFGAFPENEALIQWMRDYNASGRRTRIRFYGIDLSLGGPGGSTPTPAALEEVLSYLARADPAAARRAGALLRPFLDRLASPGPRFSPAQHDELTAAIEALPALLDRNRAALAAATSHEDYDWARQQAVVARQADRVFRVLPPELPGGRIPPSAWRAVSARGAGMSENVRWVVDREGPAGRVLVFAHNAHVKNAPTEGGIWSVFDRPPTVMGQHLRERLADGLLIIGTSLAAGSGGRPASFRPGSLDAALARVGLPLFLLDFRPARADRAVSAWLADRRPLTANGDTFLAVSPGAAFDAMLFIDAHAVPRAR